MGYEVIRYRPEFKSQVAELLTEFWPDPELNTAYFSWKYLENPFVDQPLFYLLITGNKVVGMRGFQGARWEGPDPDNTFQIPCACDFVTHSDFRGKGLAQNIMEYAFQDLAGLGYQYVFSSSATPIPYKSQIRRGWRLAGHYRTIRRETAGAGRLRAIARRMPFLRTLWSLANRKASLPGQNAFARLDALPPMALDGGMLTVAQEPDAPAMSALSNAVAVPELIRHVRGPEYFAWRYANPLMEYRFVFWRDTDLRGFLVLQKQRGNTPATRIIDWQATDLHVLKRLFGAVLEFGNLSSVATWSAALPAEMVSFLAEHGFATFDESFGVSDYSPGLQVRSLEDPLPDGPWEIAGCCLHDLADWDLRPVYSDEF